MSTETALIEGVNGLEGRIFSCVRAPSGTKLRGKTVKKICYPRHYSKVKAEAISAGRKRTTVHKITRKAGKKRASPHARCVGEKLRAQHLKGKGPGAIRSAMSRASKQCQREVGGARKKSRKKSRK